MNNKQIKYEWIAQPHGTRQNDSAKIIDTILVAGDTKYIIKTSFGEIKEIFPRQVTNIE